MTQSIPTKSFPKLIDELVAVRRELEVAKQWMRECHGTPNFWCSPDYVMAEGLLADAALRLRLASAAFIAACGSSGEQ
jgi:hypothetical protein